MKDQLKQLLLAVGLLSIFNLQHSTARAQGTAFTYEGQLNSGGSPANGNYDFTFALFNNESTNTGQVASALTNFDVGVTNGLFNVLLDFGDVFTGNATWLAIGVRTNGGSSFTALNPLQELTPTPYAIMAASASNLLGDLSVAQLSGVIPLAQLPGAVVTNNDTASVNLTGTFSGNGGGLTNIEGANLTAGSVGTMELAGGALAAPITIAGTSQTAAANTSYFATGSGTTTIYLPTNANVGDVVQITGEGPGGWKAAEYIPIIWTLTDAPYEQWFAVASSSDGTHLVAGSLIDGIPSGLIYASSDSGANWAETEAPSENWQSVASSSDGTHLVAAGGDIYISTNSGATWTQAGVPSAGYSSVASSSDGTQLVAAGVGIYTSTNFGTTWTLTGAPSVSYSGVASSSDGTHLVAVGAGIYTSTNFGTTWTRTGAPSVGYSSVASSSDGTQLVAAGDGIYTSTNSGLSWTLTGAPSEPWHSVACSSDGTHLVAVNLRQNIIYISVNSGATWTQTAAPSDTWVSVASSSDGSHLAAVTGGGGIYTLVVYVIVARGTEGSSASLQYVGNGQWQTFTPAVLNGANLIAGSVGTSQLVGGTLAAPVSIAGTNQTAAANTSYVALNANPTAFYLPTNANIGDVVDISGAGSGGWAAENSPGTWMPTSAPSAAWSSVASSSDGTHLVAVVNGSGIWTSANSGTTWTMTSGPTEEWSSVACSSDGDDLVAVVDGGGIYTSTNFGTTWTLTGAPSASYSCVASSSDGTHLVAVGDEIYISTNSGVTWTLTGAPSAGYNSVVSSSDGMVLVAAGYSYPGSFVEISTNSGAAWITTLTPGYEGTSLISIASSFDATHLVASISDLHGKYGQMSSGSILISTNFGATWTQTSAPGGNWGGPIASSSDGTHLVAVVSGFLSDLDYYGSPVGIWTSTNSGASWAPTEATSQAWTSVASSSDGTKVVAVVNGGGIYVENTDYATIASGAQGGAASLQYLGNGAWGAVSLPQSSSNAPNTAVTRDANGNFSAGTVTAMAFVGNGIGLTSLNAANLTGTLPLSSLPGSVITNTETDVGLSGTFSGDGGGLTNLNLTGPSANSVLSNSATGFSALLSNTTGYLNTANGCGALAANTTGSNNIAEGYEAGSSATNGNNNIEIGNVGTVSDNNSIYIGTQGVQTNTAIAGIFGATAAGGAPVYVTSSGQLGTLTSSARFKRDIKSMSSASDVLLSLHPVTFRYKSQIDPKGIPQFGLVAEDVEKVDPDLVVRDDKHQVYTVRYEAVNAMLLNEFLKQHHQVQKQNAEIETLKQSVAELKQLVRTLADKK